jgi:hypothetical protein
MTQRTPFDDFADQFTADLEQAATTHSRRWLPVRGAALPTRAAAARPAVRKRRVVTAGAGLAIAGTAAALVIGIGGRDLDVVGEARAAVAPGPYILHIRTEATWPEPRSAGETTIADRWTATNPTRWRLATRITDDQLRRGGPSDLRPGDDTIQETAYAGGAQSHYDSSTKTMTVVTGFDPHGVASRVPAGFELAGATADPLEAIRGMLARGDVRDAGTATVDGRAVRRLRGTIPATKEHPAWPVEADVDASTFAPVRLRYTEILRLPKGLVHRKGSAAELATHLKIDLHFTAYERLPITRANERLLQIQPAPGATVTTISHDALLAKLHRTTRCHRVKSGGTKCVAVR